MADLKNTNINDNLELPQGTTGERPASPQEGQIRFNTDLETAEFYNGSNWRPLSDTHPEAEGGTVVDTDIGGVPYRIHFYRNVGTDTFTVTNPGSVDVLVVGGGGSGGSNDCGFAAGGGGGGGGIVFNQQRFVSAGNFSVVVGAGGENNTANTGSYSNWESGQSSFFDSLEAFGGGKGGSGCSPTRAAPPGTYGGGGGGGSFDSGSDGTPGQGNDGGDSTTENGTSPAGFDGRTAGGGGPALSGNGFTDNRPGGIGGNYSAEFGNFFGENGIFAGGGGGGSDVEAKNDVPGGLGGGGEGRGDGQDGGDAINGTGGGGGGSSGDVNTIGGNGGSGIVIIRYPRNSSLDSQPDETRPSFQPYNYARDVRPIIARTGLVLELDAANPLSYPGTGTTWTDLSGNGNDGTLVNGVGYTSQNYGSLVFNGVDAYVNCGNNESLNVATGNMTAEVWIKHTEDYSDFFDILGKWGSGGYSLSQASTARPLLFVGTTNDFVYTNSSLQTDSWYHILFTKIGNEYSSYVNGVLERNKTENISNTSSTSNLIIGGQARYNRYVGDYRDGLISNVKIYNRALSESEIKQNFNATRSRYGI